MLEKSLRLRKHHEFSAVYRYKKSKATPSLVCYCMPNDGANNRFGFSLSKKIGKAHVRNRYKRRLREITRLHASSFRSGYDIILVARKNIVTLDYLQLEKEYLALMKKCGVYDA